MWSTLSNIRLAAINAWNNYSNATTDAASKNIVMPGIFPGQEGDYGLPAQNLTVQKAKDVAQNQEASDEDDLWFDALQYQNIDQDQLQKEFLSINDVEENSFKYLASKIKSASENDQKKILESFLKSTILENVRILLALLFDLHKDGFIDPLKDIAASLHDKFKDVIDSVLLNDLGFTSNAPKIEDSQRSIVIEIDAQLALMDDLGIYKYNSSYEYIPLINLPEKEIEQMVFNLENNFRNCDIEAYKTKNIDFHKLNRTLKEMSPDHLGGMLSKFISPSVYLDHPMAIYQLVAPHLDRVPVGDLGKVLKVLINHRWIENTAIGKELLPKLSELFMKLPDTELKSIQERLRGQTNELMLAIEHGKKYQFPSEAHARRVKIGEKISELLNFGKAIGSTSEAKPSQFESTIQMWNNAFA